MADGASSERPLSPHLQVWRFTPTMAASITHRATGAAIYGGTSLLAVWLICLGLFEPGFRFISGLVNSPIGGVIIGGYVWALCFHLMNGLRHLYWDFGRGFAHKTATMTAWLVYIASVIVAGLILWAGYAAKGAA